MCRHVRICAKYIFMYMTRNNGTHKHTHVVRCMSIPYRLLKGPSAHRRPEISDLQSGAVEGQLKSKSRDRKTEKDGGGPVRWPVTDDDGWSRYEGGNRCVDCGVFICPGTSFQE
jgi:hypothetical protein